MQNIFDRISEVSKSHPKPENITFNYGTAGFRLIGELLVSTVFRMGILAALRSKKLGGQTIGVMLTASHNKEEDNGLKLVEPLGEMLNQNWEKYCTSLANAEESTLIDAIKQVINDENIDISKPSNVAYGCDTRPTAKLLVNALEAGLNAIDSISTNYGVVTTPQLHYFVRCINTANSKPYGIPTEDGYNQKFAEAYKTLLNKSHVSPSELSTLHIDCANGVGAPQMEKLIPVIGFDYFKATLYNTDINTKNRLNVSCGADHVKSLQKPPVNIPLVPGYRCCSFDGDADRIMYYYVDSSNKFFLVDGDKISCLCAMYVRDLLASAGLTSLKLGVVQTAYANGSSTKYIKSNLNIPVTIAKTGVKYLHHEAGLYDIGIYFEANGHGSILFSENAIETFNSFEPQTPAQLEAIQKLIAFRDLVNEAVGDAISDMLIVEAILLSKKWTLENWNQIYTDLPNKLLKVTVTDRYIFETTNAEQTLTSPAGLQERIDSLVCKFPSGRSFVRPSGTEDAVRVYAEAAHQNDVDELALQVFRLVYEFGGGVGNCP